MEICIALRAHVAQEGLYFYFSVDRVVQMAVMGKITCQVISNQNQNHLIHE